ncbi:MAG TPA: DUF1501 domain-containing protein [Candidatus Saccharimonadales bacterium]|nr:DUF1501 domain-containing protein [Candidatus Saccharimonadales bacterium]
MKNEITLQTRRQFLRTTVLGSALTWTVPAFLADTFTALHSEAADSATQIVTGKDATILVVLQMAGGNDGINTVVPYGNDYYHNARPKIGLAPQQVLKLTGEIGFHNALTGFKNLYNAGHLSVVQGVGYPNPNRSHFRSTEIWQTASDSDKVEKYGWLGRYFDNACPGCDPTVGVDIGGQTPQSFFAKTPTGISLANPESYRFMSPGHFRPGQVDLLEESYEKINEIPDAGPDMNAGGSIGALAAGVPQPGGSVLHFIERTALDAQVSSEKIRSIIERVKNQASYPSTKLGENLKLVAQLIAGGLPTRVYYVSQGGYDTHANQAGTQYRLLKELGDAVNAFVADLKAQGNLQRVLVMTFSEFGRRVAENASGGTDHGAAAPLFVIGNKVKAGLLGRYPSLAPQDLFEGDIKYTVDFRSVYASVLENWLKTKSVPILGRQFEPLQLV